jgi:hypothetical protein
MISSLSSACVNFGFSDLVVASPIEDYFIFIDELPDKEKVFLLLIYLSIETFFFYFCI